MGEQVKEDRLWEHFCILHLLYMFAPRPINNFVHALSFFPVQSVVAVTY